jgi:hypothetical protein
MSIISLVAVAPCERGFCDETSKLKVYGCPGGAPCIPKTAINETTGCADMFLREISMFGPPGLTGVVTGLMIETT